MVFSVVGLFTKPPRDACLFGVFIGANQHLKGSQAVADQSLQNLEYDVARLSSLSLATPLRRFASSGPRRHEGLPLGTPESRLGRAPVKFCSDCTFLLVETPEKFEVLLSNDTPSRIQTNAPSPKEERSSSQFFLNCRHRSVIAGLNSTIYRSTSRRSDTRDSLDRTGGTAVPAKYWPSTRINQSRANH